MTHSEFHLGQQQAGGVFSVSIGETRARLLLLLQHRQASKRWILYMGTSALIATLYCSFFSVDKTFDTFMQRSSPRTRPEWGAKRRFRRWLIWFILGACSTFPDVQKRFLTCFNVGEDTVAVSTRRSKTRWKWSLTSSCSGIQGSVVHQSFASLFCTEKLEYFLRKLWCHILLGEVWRNRDYHCQ